jgi:hypothetical protein
MTNFPPRSPVRGRFRSPARNNNNRDRGNRWGGGRPKKYIKNVDAFDNLNKVDWAMERLEPLKKNFYQPSSSVYSRKTVEVERWREARYECEIVRCKRIIFITESNKLQGNTHQG